MLSFPSFRTSLLETTVSSRSYAGLKLGKASHITPRIYLSDYCTARDSTELSRLRITHVVSVIDIDPEIPPSIPAAHKLHIAINDRPDVDILVHLAATTEFIRAALSENESNVVLVHCFQGVSRSATVVCAYLVATEGMLACDSIAFVQSKRGIVSPNLGFRKQLETYGEQFIEKHPKHPKHMKRISSGIAGRIKLFRSGNSGK